MAQKVQIRPATGCLGAEVLGVDLSSPLSDGMFDLIHDAWMQWHVLFFRDQTMTVEEFRSLGERFGELEVHPASPATEGFPEVARMHADESSTRVVGEAWHSDLTFELEPPKATILRLEQVPDYGGDTVFADMAAVLDGISAPLRSLLSTLHATHRPPVYWGKDPEIEAHHPVVRTHPVTGRSSLFVNSLYTTAIDGLEKDESAQLLALLFDRVKEPQHQFRFRWEPSSLVLWDNRVVQHSAVGDYWPQTRSGYRMVIKGDRPFLTP
jgi:taurine dioxygenase